MDILKEGKSLSSFSFYCLNRAIIQVFLNRWSLLLNKASEDPIPRISTGSHVETGSENHRKVFPAIPPKLQTQLRTFLIVGGTPKKRNAMVYKSLRLGIIFHKVKSTRKKTAVERPRHADMIRPHHLKDWRSDPAPKRQAPCRPMRTCCTWG